MRTNNRRSPSEAHRCCDVKAVPHIRILLVICCGFRNRQDPISIVLGTSQLLKLGTFFYNEIRKAQMCFVVILFYFHCIVFVWFFSHFWSYLVFVACISFNCFWWLHFIFICINCVHYYCVMLLYCFIRLQFILLYCIVWLCCIWLYLIIVFFLFCFI